MTSLEPKLRSIFWSLCYSLVLKFPTTMKSIETLMIHETSRQKSHQKTAKKSHLFLCETEKRLTTKVKAQLTSVSSIFPLNMNISDSASHSISRITQDLFACEVSFTLPRESYTWSVSKKWQQQEKKLSYPNVTLLSRKNFFRLVNISSLKNSVQSHFVSLTGIVLQVESEPWRVLFNLSILSDCNKEQNSIFHAIFRRVEEEKELRHLFNRNYWIQRFLCLTQRIEVSERYSCKLVI